MSTNINPPSTPESLEQCRDVLTAGVTRVSRPKAVYLLGGESYDLIYPAAIRRELEQYVDFVTAPVFSEDFEDRKSELSEVEVIFSGWNLRMMDADFLATMPNLKVVFYGAGSVRYCTTPEFWERDILITSSNAANAVPVAEYAMSTILLSLKHFWPYARKAKMNEGRGDHTRPLPGAYHTNVGLVSCGLIARRTLKLLQQFDLNLFVSCPFLTEKAAQQLGVKLCSLDDLFSRCDVVSLHTPNLPETQGMIQRKHFERMKPGATFINTARGAIVREPDLIEVASLREDLTFVLDVTCPEPPENDSKLLTLPNVVLTPHIAGSMGPEIGRLGEYMLEEVKRYVAGKSLRWQITREAAEKMA